MNRLAILCLLLAGCDSRDIAIIQPPMPAQHIPGIIVTTSQAIMERNRGQRTEGQFADRLITPGDASVLILVGDLDRLSWHEVQLLSLELSQWWTLRPDAQRLIMMGMP